MTFKSLAICRLRAAVNEQRGGVTEGEARGDRHERLLGRTACVRRVVPGHISRPRCRPFHRAISVRIAGPLAHRLCGFGRHARFGPAEVARWRITSSVGISGLPFAASGMGAPRVSPTASSAIVLCVRFFCVHNRLHQARLPYEMEYIRNRQIPRARSGHDL